jgi:hypothetical protein
MACLNYPLAKVETGNPNCEAVFDYAANATATIYICMYVCMYVYIHICIYICMYTHTYIHIFMDVCMYVTMLQRLQVLDIPPRPPA